MPTSILRRQTREQAELARGRLALSALRAALVTREHSLDDLRAQLFSFEGRYIRQVGKLYAQLDEWETKIGELNSPLLLPGGADPPEPEAKALAQNRGTEDGGDLDAAIDLKALFRELAKRIHPDFSRGEADAQQRTRLMAQANDAFRRQDAGMLQRMLNGHEAQSSIESTTEQLARVLEQLAHVERDITRIDAEIDALTHSELARLQQRVLLAAQGGRDLLAEMAARVKGNIGMAMRRYELDLERRKRKQPAFDPTSLLSAEIVP